MSAPSVEQLLAGGGAAAWKPQAIGDKIVGFITAKEVRQQTHPGPERKLRTYPDGKPMWQIILTLATDLRDPEIEDDDGTRRVYCNYEGQKALSAACKEVGAKSVEIGGKLLMKVSGTHPNKHGGVPVKEYSARYKAPDPVADVLDGMDGEQYTGEADDGFEDAPAAPAAPPRKAAAKAKAAAPAVTEYVDDDDAGF